MKHYCNEIWNVGNSVMSSLKFDNYEKDINIIFQ